MGRLLTGEASEKALHEFGEGDIASSLNSLDNGSCLRPKTQGLPSELGNLRQTTCVLFWLGDGAVVADQAVIAHISADLDKKVGTPTITTDIAKIFELMVEA
jgi:hypothetical protein